MLASRVRPIVNRSRRDEWGDRAEQEHLGHPAHQRRSPVEFDRAGARGGPQVEPTQPHLVDRVQVGVDVDVDLEPGGWVHTDGPEASLTTQNRRRSPRKANSNTIRRSGSTEKLRRS